MAFVIAYHPSYQDAPRYSTVRGAEANGNLTDDLARAVVFPTVMDAVAALNDHRSLSEPKRCTIKRLVEDVVEAPSRTVLAAIGEAVDGFVVHVPNFFVAPLGGATPANRDTIAPGSDVSGAFVFPPFYGARAILSADVVKRFSGVAAIYGVRVIPGTRIVTRHTEEIV